MRLKLLGTLFLFLSFALSTACESRSGADEFRTEMQTASSWAATAHMAGEAWLKGAVPAHYAGRTLRTAGQTLSETRDTLEKSSLIPGDQRSKAVDHLRNLAGTIEELWQAVRSGDRAHVQEQVEELTAEEKALKRFTSGAGRPR